LRNVKFCACSFLSLLDDRSFCAQRLHGVTYRHAAGVNLIHRRQHAGSAFRTLNLPNALGCPISLRFWNLGNQRIFRTEQTWILISNQAESPRRRLAIARVCLKTHSQLTPNSLARGYLCVLPCSNKCRKICYLRDCAVTHNPKVAGSNPAPATKIINKLRLNSFLLQDPV